MLSQPETRATQGAANGVSALVNPKQAASGRDSFRGHPARACSGGESSSLACPGDLPTFALAGSRQLRHEDVEGSGANRERLHSALQQRERWPVKAARRVYRRGEGWSHWQRRRCEHRGARRPLPRASVMQQFRFLLLARWRPDRRQVPLHGLLGDAFRRSRISALSPGSA